MATRLRSFNHAPRPSQSRKGTRADSQAKPGQAIRLGRDTCKSPPGRYRSRQYGSGVSYSSVRRPSAQPDEIQAAPFSAVCRGYGKVSEFSRDVGGSGVTMFEVVTLAHRLHQELMKTKPRRSKWAQYTSIGSVSVIALPHGQHHASRDLGEHGQPEQAPRPPPPPIDVPGRDCGPASTTAGPG